VNVASRPPNSFRGDRPAGRRRRALPPTPCAPPLLGPAVSLLVPIAANSGVRWSPSELRTSFGTARPRRSNVTFIKVANLSDSMVDVVRSRRPSSSPGMSLGYPSRPPCAANTTRCRRARPCAADSASNDHRKGAHGLLCLRSQVEVARRDEVALFGCRLWQC
jgi:hypothetical protein